MGANINYIQCGLVANIDNIHGIAANNDGLDANQVNYYGMGANHSMISNLLLVLCCGLVKKLECRLKFKQFL